MSARKFPQGMQKIGGRSVIPTQPLPEPTPTWEATGPFIPDISREEEIIPEHEKSGAQFAGAFGD